MLVNKDTEFCDCINSIAVTVEWMVAVNQIEHQEFISQDGAIRSMTLRLGDRVRIDAHVK
jgi:hypothetical protein